MENMIHRKTALKTALHKTIVTFPEAKVSNTLPSSYAMLREYTFSKDLNIHIKIWLF